MITQDNLNRQTVEAFSNFVALLPNYIAGISNKPTGSGVTITLANPCQSDQPLTILTDNLEITILFGGAHSHISDYDKDKNEKDLIEDAIVAAMRLVTGIDAAYTAWSNDRCIGGGMIYPNTKDEDIGKMFRHADRIKVTAWSVNHNREIRK